MSANNPVLRLMVPAALAASLVASLGACTQTGSGTQPGYVNTSASNGYNNGSYNNGSYGGSYNGGAQTGDQGRVMSIREVPLRGGQGMNDGTLVGGGLGAAGGAAIGAATTNSVGGAVVGGLLGAVGGAIAGNIVGRGSSTQRGIEVTVQKDDGQTVTIAQADNGDVQMGDRVRIVQDRNGVAVAVRDQSRREQ
jgi:outer membrane lipoprotein SlyB